MAEGLLPKGQKEEGELQVLSGWTELKIQNWELAGGVYKDNGCIKDA